MKCGLSHCAGLSRAGRPLPECKDGNAATVKKKMYAPKEGSIFRLKFIRHNLRAVICHSFLKIQRRHYLKNKLSSLHLVSVNWFLGFVIFPLLNNSSTTHPNAATVKSIIDQDRNIIIVEMASSVKRNERYLAVPSFLSPMPCCLVYNVCTQPSVL